MHIQFLHKPVHIYIITEKSPTFLTIITREYKHQQRLNKKLCNKKHESQIMGSNWDVKIILKTYNMKDIKTHQKTN